MLLHFDSRQDIPRPDLDLDFRRGPPLDPRITFTRNGLLTYLGPDGLLKTAAINEPAFNWNPAQNRYELQAWEQRANLLLWSEQFDNAAWSKTGLSVTENDAIAPDGASTADKLTNTSGITSLISMVVAVTPSATNDYYPTLYVKRGNIGSITLNVYYPGNIEDNVTFFLDSGTQSGAPYGEYMLQNLGSGWYRVGYRMTRDATGSRASIAYRMWESGRATGVAGNYHHVWGAQLEEGAFPTPYSKNEGSTATRGADVISMTGANFSDWFRGDKGTFVVEFTQAVGNNYSGTFRHVLHAVPTSGVNSSIGIFPSGTNKHTLQVRDGAANQAVIEAGTHLETSKIACSYTKDAFYVVSNGREWVSDLSGNAPTTDPLTRMLIGSVQDGNPLGHLNGGIARIRYWRKALPIGQLQRLSV